LNEENRSWYLGNKKTVAGFDGPTLRRAFWDRLDWHIDNVVAPWFDNFKAVTGIDIEALDFDRKKGFLIVPLGNIHFHLYKLEQMDAFQSAMGEMPGYKGIEYLHENNAAKKWYADHLKAFFDGFEVSEGQIAKLHRIGWVRALYDEEQLSEICSRYRIVPS